MPKRIFAYTLFLVLMVASCTAGFGLMSLNWGVTKWTMQRGRELISNAKKGAAEFTWQDVAGIKQGDVSSPAFKACLKKLQRLEGDVFKENRQTCCLTVVVAASPRSYLVRRVADPEYYPDIDDGKPGVGEDDEAVDQVIAGEPSSSRQTWNDKERPQLSGYAPILDASGQVRAVFEVDEDSSPTADLRGVVVTTYLWCFVPAILGSVAVSVMLAARYVEPTHFLHEIHQTMLQGQHATARDDVAEAVGETNPVPSWVSEAKWDELTKAELAIATSIGQGNDVQSIAARRVVETGTIRKQLNAIFKKLGIKSQRQLAIIAVYHGALETSRGDSSTVEGRHQPAPI